MRSPAIRSAVTGPDRTRAVRATFFVLILSLAAFVVGCEQAYRIPRIEPVLHGWSRPYRGVEGIRVHVFNTGTMSLPAALVYRGAGIGERRDLDVAAFVIEHPGAGLVVFDTGFNTRVRDAPEDYLGFLLTAVGSYEMGPGQELAAQMRAAGLEPDEVSRVVLSHLHFDHAGGVEQFENATVVVAHAEREWARSPSWLDPIIADDTDGVTSWLEVDYAGGEPLATFRSHHDLLGDGSIVLVDLAGHTPGSQGMLVSAAGQPLLLTGGAAAVEESWRYAARPAFAHDPELWWEQIWRIKKLVQLEPSVVIVPAHDIEAIERAGCDAIEIHAWEPPAEHGDDPDTAGG